MDFFTSVKAHVPILGGDESEEESGSEATLRLVNSSCLATPRLNEEDKQDGDEEEEGLKEGLSTETVNTITGEEETSSQNSTPTPNLQSERFSYDVDPELGAFV